MLTGTDNTMTRRGNVGDTAQAMTIDPEAMQHIMHVLTSMYSDNHAAVVREYVCNALDSHTEAGQTRPVDVFTPNEWNPKLVVRDYGVGLDRDGILNVYSVYGKSTRRSSNESIGGFGIGSKAGFTLAGQFVVTGIKDGKKTVALFSLDEHGAPTVEILVEKNTEENNGVEVAIAVDSVSKICDAIDRLSLTWPSKAVLVNGMHRNNVLDDAKKIVDGVYTVNQSWGLTVVMSGVAYKIPDSILNDLYTLMDESDLARIALNRISRHETGLIVDVPIGSVTVAPNREMLSNTPTTMNTLKVYLRKYGTEQARVVNNIAANSGNAFEAFEKLRPYTDSLGMGYLTSLDFRGHKLKPFYFPDETARVALRYGNRGYKKNAQLRLGRFIMESFSKYDKYLFITGMTPDNYNKVTRLANRFLSSNKNLYEEIVMVEDTIGSYAWFEWGGNSPIKTLTLEEFRLESKKLPSIATRGEVKYDYYNYTSNGKHSTWSKTTPWTWARATAPEIADVAEGEIYFSDHSPVHFSHRAFNYGDIVILLDGSKKREPMEKRLGHVTKSFEEVWGTYLDNMRSTVSSEVRLALAAYNINGNFTSVRDTLRQYGYVNPKLDRLVTDSEQGNNVLSQLSPEDLSFYRHCLGVDDSLITRYTEWYSRYVLVEQFLSHQARYPTRQKPNYMKHVVDYMKAIDSQEEK